MFKVFQVGEETEFIAAMSSEEAVNDHWNRYDQPDEMYGSKENVPVVEVNLDNKGMFEQETGPYKEMSWREFIGEDFDYKGPKLLCWNE